MQHFPAITKIKKAIRLTEVLGLIVIAIATLIAGIQEVMSMFARLEVTLADLLMLFLYLEVLAMVAIYMDSGKLPIRFPLYISIIALARYLILDMKNLDIWHILVIGITMLLIAITVIIIRYGHMKLPYGDQKQLEENLKN